MPENTIDSPGSASTPSAGAAEISPAAGLGKRSDGAGSASSPTQSGAAGQDVPGGAQAAVDSAVPGTGSAADAAAADAPAARGPEGSSAAPGGDSAAGAADAVAQPGASSALGPAPDSGTPNLAGPDLAGPDLPIEGGWLAGVQQFAAPMAETAGSGGPVLMVLGLLSIAALAIVLVKLWQFARLRINAREPVATALSLWMHGESGRSIERLAHRRQPQARLVQRALIGLAQPGVRLDVLREELMRFAAEQLQALRAWLRALEVIAALSPLLGLLGTVLGMIEAFRQLETAGSQVDPAILSGGIWQALLTTAAGLIVAIPVLMLHAWLERRVERCAHAMEDAVTRVLTRDLAGVAEHGAVALRGTEPAPRPVPSPAPAPAAQAEAVRYAL
ncbi:MAG: MotA/TolQ/ExbB proton channel family protein [Thiohalocapsa sp.]|nr:MotA/TolQ/ExbB proton channel family protein [Thiohalocapsa sp.]